ncbi:tyrosine-type recombinase/integrase [Oceanobacillus sp. CAU 1775]
MRGSIIKTGKTYAYVIDMGVDLKTGKRKLKKVDGFLKKIDAEAELKTLLLEIHKDLEQSDVWERIPSNFVSLIDSPIVNQKETNTWEIDEVDRFIIACRTEEQYIAFFIAIFTGLRAREILSLKWGDINFEEKYIQVNYSKPSKYISRRIPISKFLVEELISHKENQEDLKLQMENFQNNYLVISAENGKSLNPVSLNDALERIIKVAGVNDINFQDIRRIHVFNLFSEGIDIQTIANRLGHSNSNNTLVMYEHFLSQQSE